MRSRKILWHPWRFQYANLLPWKAFERLPSVVSWCFIHWQSLSSSEFRSVSVHDKNGMSKAGLVKGRGWRFLCEIMNKHQVIGFTVWTNAQRGSHSTAEEKKADNPARCDMLSIKYWECSCFILRWMNRPVKLLALSNTKLVFLCKVSYFGILIVASYSHWAIVGNLIYSHLFEVLFFLFAFQTSALQLCYGGIWFSKSSWSTISQLQMVVFCGWVLRRKRSVLWYFL